MPACHEIYTRPLFQAVLSLEKPKQAGELEISLGVHVLANYRWQVSWAQGLTSTVWHGQLIQVRSIQGLCENIFFFKKVNQGMTLRDGMGREVGKRFRMGNTCTPMADSCQYMAKPPQYCKVISLQLKKTNKHIMHAATAAAAKSLQSCPTLCDPRDGSPSGSPIPGILIDC